ncbi:MAG: hypothetical protein JWL61_2220 [Gemmatimonadetes bacterium]|nr:hypothetical protein [Gemmatimonadota bacterium]
MSFRAQSRDLLFALVVTTFASSQARAQNARACMDRLAPPTADSVRSTFAATVQSFNPRRPLPPTYAELLGEGLRQELKLPPGLMFPVFEADSIPTKASPATKTWMAVPSMSVLYGVTIDSGKITRIRRIAGASSISFDVAVATALTVLDSSASLPPLPPELGPEPLEISVAIGRMPLRQMRASNINPGVPVTPLFIVLSPAHVVSQPVSRGADFSRFIPQPPTKRDDEAVVVRVVVGPDGLVDQESMHVLAYSSTDYIRSVFEMIPNWKFKPLMLMGCEVSAIEELTFTQASGVAKP